MKHITIYTTPTCPYCMRAKQLLSSLGISYQEVDVANDTERRERLVATYDWQTVPMIVIGDEFIGGYDDLAKLHAEGTLMEKLKNE